MLGSRVLILPMLLSLTHLPTKRPGSSIHSAIWQERRRCIGRRCKLL